MSGMNQRTTPGRRSPLEVHGDPEGDERVCPLCGALGREHSLAREVLVDAKYSAWLSGRAASKPYLLCPRDALPEHGGPRPLAASEYARSLLGVLRTMGDGELRIYQTANGFKVDVSGVHFVTPECREYMQMLTIAVNYEPR